MNTDNIHVITNFGQGTTESTDELLEKGNRQACPAITPS